MLTPQEILDYLARQSAVLTGSHFVYTSGNHGTAYVNMRKVAYDARWLAQVGKTLAAKIAPYEVDLVVGPETLGRTLADHTAPHLPNGMGIWCDITGSGDEKVASFSEKLDFAWLVCGRRVAIVDDLLTTGTSVRAVSRLIEGLGGQVAVTAVVVRRDPEVNAADCSTAALVVLADVQGFESMTEEECKAQGPCSRQIPVALRPGHGHKWIEDHPDYPVAS